jgi:class 3 adenylate cyclase
VIIFVNQIAEITHTAVTKYGGAANKNLGDAYLLVWKFPNPNELKTKEPLESIKFSAENRTIADMSVFAFLKVLARINKYQHIRRYRKHHGLTTAIKDYKVKMGFGLH